jgi:hypothetical protein
MAAERAPMRKVREVLRLRHALSRRSKGGAVAREQDGGAPPTTCSKGVCAKDQVATYSERRRSLVTNRWPRRSIAREGSKGRRKESETAVLTGGVSAAT